MFASNLEDMKTTLVQDTAAVVSAVRAMATHDAFLDLELKCADGAAVRTNATLLCACSPTIASLYLRGETNVDVTSQTLSKIVSLVSAGSLQLQCADERSAVLEAVKRLQICGFDSEGERETAQDVREEIAEEDVRDEITKEAVDSRSFFNRVESWRCVSQADTEPTVDEDLTDSLRDFDDEDDAESKESEDIAEVNNADSAEKITEQKEQEEKTQEVLEVVETEDKMEEAEDTAGENVNSGEKMNEELQLGEKTLEVSKTVAVEDETTQLVAPAPGDISGVQQHNEKNPEIVEMTEEDEMTMATQLVTRLPIEKDDEVSFRVVCDDSGVESESEADISAESESRPDESYSLSEGGPLPLTPPASPLSTASASDSMLRSVQSSLKSRRRSSGGGGRRFGLRSGYSLRRRAVLVMGIASRIWRCADCDFWQYYRNKVERHQFIHSLESHQ